MLRNTTWRLIEVPELDQLPRPIQPRTQTLLPRQLFPLHDHRWHQLVYATEGSLVVTVDDAWHVISPEQAMWIPAGVVHTTGSLAGAAFRNLYLDCAIACGLPAQCVQLAVSPLLRALIVELEQAVKGGEPADYLGQLDALILAQLQRAPQQYFQLPWPQSPMLERLCNALHANPADERSLDEWGRELGASPRTLARHFERELGMSLRQWRYRLRLFLAIEWLASGRNVTEVALALGYASTSAFSYMFRRATGLPPTHWGRQRQAGAPR